MKIDIAFLQPPAGWQAFRLTEPKGPSAGIAPRNQRTGPLGTEGAAGEVPASALPAPGPGLPVTREADSRDADRLRGLVEQICSDLRSLGALQGPGDCPDGDPPPTESVDVRV